MPVEPPTEPISEGRACDRCYSLVMSRCPIAAVFANQHLRKHNAMESDHALAVFGFSALAKLIGQ